MTRAQSVCTTPGCPNLTPRGQCHTCRRTQRRNIDRRRPNSHQRGYDDRWRKTARAYLAAHTTCECDDCLKLPASQRPRSSIVDHIDGRGPLGPRGHDPSNLRAMTHRHHNRRTARDQPAGWNA